MDGGGTVTTLQALRNDLAQSLTDLGVPAYDYLPERLNPPAAIVTAGDPYVEQGMTYCTFKVSLQIHLLAGTQVNKKATDALDDLILTALQATDGWDIEAVAEPSTFTTNNAEYLGTVIRLSQETILERNDSP